MPQVDFYHLTDLPLERVLPQVAQKVLDGGGRLLVVAGDEEQAAALDRLLWLPPDSFLPHGRAGEGDDTAQPVLIATDVDAANGARNIALADGMWRDDALDFDRAFYFFDEERIRPARASWKALKARDGVACRYWKLNEAGRWEQAA